MGAGCALHVGYQVWRAPHPDPVWAGVVPNLRRITPREIETQFPGQGYVDGWVFTTIICEGKYYLPWLLKKFEKVRL